MAIKSDVPIRLPKPFAAFSLHLMVSTNTAQGFPHNWSSSEFNRLPVKFLASARTASSPSWVHFKSVTSQQTVPSSWSSHELDGLIAESPKNGDCKWQPAKVTNSTNCLDVETRSPESQTGILQLVSRPGDIWVSSLHMVESTSRV